MQIKITEPGWETFTGTAGGNEFVNGVSVHELSQIDQQKLANNIKCETLDGKNPSTAQRIIDTDALTLAQMQSIDPVESVAPVVEKVYTREELEQIADAGGITALRLIADPKGLKSNSIARLIEMILTGVAGVTEEVTV